ncbi:hypothetical protein BX616_000261 [Lobosporangium transversale]|uniref:Mediator of RNA polymerase II transcription subunit 11 n=1 Tax=Lobosporangium transversale TaxID=64571 RepID=A0A1Y2GBS1_9FUNG|nr:hypothetical protein BCR41DRAFT_425212 [Lobosporangium transversale]KAF9908016.1 hypothetical protein BX616_000261 [Lobosporangium transversale]ORZ06401.1 hypothetical protein BCR41DRAFT_425212 [Lobosporangium transversale]|eukprot:XP_021877564.1 hypothetical protein BCR41DRAFT_425212 [Lobosporangium transversale]
MEDTNMASPPGSSHPSSSLASDATEYSDSQSQSQSQSQSRSQTTTARSKSKPRRTVNDGYIYQAYDDYTRRKKNQDDTDGVDSILKEDNNQTSATRILELRGLERRIVQLLETAGQAIQILSGDDDEEEENEEVGKRLLAATSLSPEARKAMVQEYADERAKKFETLATGYATLVDEIQSGLRRQFHYLTKAGISSSQVPFKNVVYGEEKELDTWLNAADLLKQSTNELIAKINRELLSSVNEQQNSTSADSAVVP